MEGGGGEVGLEGAQEGKGVAGKSHRGSSANKRHPSQDLGVAAKSSQGRGLQRPPARVRRLRHVEWNRTVLRRALNPRPLSREKEKEEKEEMKDGEGGGFGSFPQEMSEEANYSLSWITLICAPAPPHVIL